MIIEPDFLSHWKTHMLTNELGDKCSPLYVIALWAHCQQRKSDTFSNLAPSALKAICRYEGEASKLRSALERCGFIRVEGEAIVVHGWAETNVKLVSNWTNGAKGGRPKNPTETQPKPNRNPNQEAVSPTVTDREDREEKIPPNPQGGSEAGILPNGWKKLSQAEKGRKKVNLNDPMMIRIGKFLGQRESTLWTIAEYLALQDVNPSEEDLDLIEQHYSLVIENNGYRFKDLLTLLNNWPKARTRASAYFDEHPTHRNA